MPGQVTRDGREQARPAKSLNQAVGRTYPVVADLMLASDGGPRTCTRRNFLCPGRAGTGVRCLAAWTPSKNISISAIRMTTTAMIDKTETYIKNAPVLPRSRIPEKTKMKLCMSLDEVSGQRLPELR